MLFKTTFIYIFALHSGPVGGDDVPGSKVTIKPGEEEEEEGKKHPRYNFSNFTAGTMDSGRQSTVR